MYMYMYIFCMTEIIIMTSMLTMNMLFCFMKHPLSMGLILLIQTILSAMLIGLTMWTFWFSYILFLIMIGALIVLFIYMTSLTPNKKFKFKKYLIWLIFGSLTLIMFFSMNDLMSLFANYSSNDMNIFNNSINSNMNEKIKLTWLYDKLEQWMTFIMINYLLFVLFIVVKIININKGMMRKTN